MAICAKLNGGSREQIVAVSSSRQHPRLCWKLWGKRTILWADKALSVKHTEQLFFFFLFLLPHGVSCADWHHRKCSNTVHWFSIMLLNCEKMKMNLKMSQKHFHCVGGEVLLQWSSNFIFNHQVINFSGFLHGQTQIRYRLGDSVVQKGFVHKGNWWRVVWQLLVLSCYCALRMMKNDLVLKGWTCWELLGLTDGEWASSWQAGEGVQGNQGLLSSSLLSSLRMNDNLDKGQA